MEHKYKISYDVKEASLTKQELLEKNIGGCDEIGIISVMGGVHKGIPLSVAFMSKTEEGSWTSEQWFEIWALLSHELATSEEPLALELKEIASEAFERVRELKLRNRGN